MDEKELLKRLKEYHKNTDTITAKFTYKGKKGGRLGHQKLYPGDFNGNVLTDSGMARLLNEIVELIAYVKQQKKKNAVVDVKDVVITKYNISHRHQFN